jgi:hypothetical protein
MKKLAVAFAHLILTYRKQISLAAGGLLLLFFIFLTPVIVRSYYDAYSYLEKGKASLKAGNIEAAVQNLSTSIRWRSPFNPWAKDACALLYFLATTPPLSPKLKLYTLQAYKSAIIAKGDIQLERTHIQNALPGYSLENKQINSTTLHQSLEYVETEIARLTKNAALDIKSEDKIRDLLTPRLSKTYQILSQFFFFSWILFVVLTIFTGFYIDGKVRWIPLSFGAITASSLFVLFCFMLSKA